MIPVHENKVNHPQCRSNMQKRTTHSTKFQWDHLRVVGAIARAGTLIGAAGELGLDHTTIARQLTRLEEELGERLFDRNRSGLVTTPFGEEVLATAENVEGEINHLLRRVDSASSSLTGSVRLTTTPTLAAHVIAPALGGLFALHPELQLELVADDRVLDISRREADIALRLSRPKTPGLVAKRVGDMAFEWYVAARDKRSINHLAILLYEDVSGHSPLLRHVRSTVGSEKTVLTSNSIQALLEAAKAGIGRALLPRLIADREPRLRRLSGPSEGIVLPLWVTYHEDLRRSPRIKAVVEFIGNALKDAGSRLA